MYRAKTVFVLGAGASAEVGLPLGSALLKEIVGSVDFEIEFGRAVRGDSHIWRALQLKCEASREKLNQFVHAGHELANVALHHNSIDYIIDALEDPVVEALGKLAIARAILDHEHRNHRFRPRNGPDSIHPDAFTDSWFLPLVQTLVEDMQRSRVGELLDEVSFVNFNYDRTLEHYLPFALAAAYRLTLQQGREITNGLRMYRPYGRVGRLPWQSGEGPNVPFGYSSWELMAEVSTQIRTFTERTAENDYIQSMRRELAQADRIVFLGFAFHPQNVELIGTAVSSSCEILGTVLGLSDDEQSVVGDALCSNFEIHDLDAVTQVRLAPMGCLEFFQCYGRRLRTRVARNYSAMERLG